MRGRRGSGPGRVRLGAAALVVSFSVLVLAAAPAARGQLPPERPDPTAARPAVIARPAVMERLLIQTDAVVLHHGPARSVLQDAEPPPGFYLRRARFGADVEAGLWRARMMVEIASQSETASGGGSAGIGAGVTDVIGLDAAAGERGGAAPRATEAFLALVPHQAFTLAAGSLRVPLGLSRQIDEGALRLPERARIVARTTPDYRVGAAAAGDLGALQYALGAYAATPRLRTEGADFSAGGILYVFRLAGEPVGPMGVTPHLRRRDDPWYPWWRFSLGLSAFHLRLPGDNELGLGGDAQFQRGRLCITGEALWTRRGTADRVGATVEPGIFLVPERVELVTRVEWFNDRVGPREPADAWGAAAGITLFSTTRQARAQVAYTTRWPLAADERPSGWAVLRATFTM